MLTKLHDQYPVFRSCWDRLHEKEDIIAGLSIQQKQTLILQTLNIMAAGSKHGNYKTFLPELELANGQGSLTHPLLEPENLILINRSSTGLYERREQLWPSERL